MENSSLLPIINGPPMMLEPGAQSIEPPCDGPSFNEIFDQQVENSYEIEGKKSSPEADEEMGAYAAAEPQKQAATEAIEPEMEPDAETANRSEKTVQVTLQVGQTVVPEQLLLEANPAESTTEADIKILTPAPTLKDSGTEKTAPADPNLAALIKQANAADTDETGAEVKLTVDATQVESKQVEGVAKTTTDIKSGDDFSELISSKNQPAAKPEIAPEPEQMKGKVSNEEQIKIEVNNTETTIKAAQIKPAVREETLQSANPIEPDMGELGPISVTMQQKISEPARMAEARDNGMVPQISSGIEEMFRSGKSSMRLQMHPDHLGRITLKLIQDSGGLQVVIHAENADTNSLLERNLDDLYRSLSKAGVDINGFNIGGQSDNQANPQEAFQKPASRLFNSTEGSGPSDEMMIPSSRPAAQTAVDYLI